jgi:hypothetical protein
MSRPSFGISHRRVVWQVLLIAATFGGAAADAAMIDVKAKVAGVANRTIGSIATTDGAANTALKAKFTFANDYKFLDDWFDFRWVQLLIKNELDGVVQPADVDGAFPQIDPQPNDNPAPMDGPAPYYYNGKEWADKMFGTTVIRADNDFSMLVDAPGPGWPGKTKLFFETFLVADDITANLVKDKEFIVLAGFTWTHDSGATNGAPDNTNTAGAEFAVDDAAIGRINTALGNAMRGGNFNGWKPIKSDGLDFLQCPEPASAGMLTVALVLLTTRRRQRIAA